MKKKTICMIIALSFVASMLILAVYADSASALVSSNFTNTMINGFDCYIYEEADIADINRYEICPFCYGHQWSGTGCSGISASTSEAINCNNHNHPNCSVTAEYYYNVTYCRDCGYPRQITSTHTHYQHHSYMGWTFNECPY